MAEEYTEGWGDDAPAAPAVPAELVGSTHERSLAAGDKAPEEYTEGWGDEPKNEGTANAVARGALHGATFGGGGAAAAAIDTAVSKIPGLRDLAQYVQSPDLPPLTDPNISFAERRAQYAAKNKAAEEGHPWAYLAGDIGGSLATGAAGERILAAGAAKVAPGAVAALARAAEANPIRAAVARGVAEGAGYGAASGAGEAASQGQDIGTGAARGAGYGALTGAPGGAISGVLGKVVQKFTKPADETIMSDLLGHGSLVNTSPRAENAAMAAQKNIDYVMEHEPGLKTMNEQAGLGNGEHMEAYQKAVGAQLKKMKNPRTDNYAAVEAARPIKVTDVARELRAAADEAGSEPSGEAVQERLNYWAKRVEDTWGQKGPDYPVPLLGLRKMVSDVQSDAGPRLSTETVSTRNRKLREVADAVGGVLDRQLDATAAAVPGVARTVEDIRHDNRMYNGLLAMKTVIDQRIKRHGRSKLPFLKRVEHHLTSINPLAGAAAGAGISYGGEALGIPYAKELGKVVGYGAIGMGGPRYLARHPGGFAALRKAIELAGKAGSAQQVGAALLGDGAP